MAKVFICQIQSEELDVLQSVLNSIGSQGEHIVLLPEYINSTTTRPLREIAGIRAFLEDYTRTNTERHVLTSIMRGGENWTVHYHTGTERPIYQKVKGDGIWRDSDRTSSLLTSNTSVEIGRQRVRILCCRDHELSGELAITNELVFIPSYMGSDDFSGAPLGHQLRKALTGNHVFMANKKANGCPSFYADPSGQVIMTAGRSRNVVMGLEIKR